MTAPGQIAAADQAIAEYKAMIRRLIHDYHTSLTGNDTVRTGTLSLALGMFTQEDTAAIAAVAIVMLAEAGEPS